MAEPVHVIGVGRTDFKCNFLKENRTLRDAILEAARTAITDAGIDASAIQYGVVGNFAAGSFSKQLHLGAFLTEIDPRLRGIPTLHTEAACASGGVAVLTAAHQIMGGFCDVALVVGAEQQKTMSPAEGGEVLAQAGDYATEKTQYGDFTFPKLFGRVASLYMERHALTEEQLSLVSVKNQMHARKNPLAQMRESTLTVQQACTITERNLRLAPPLRTSDCSQITDGAAAIVLCSERFARRLGKAGMRLLGYSHATDHLALDKKDVPDFSVACNAARQAYSMAGISPRDLHGAEVHDCFSISEILAYEILGFAARGEGPKLLQSGATAHSSIRQNLPLNTQLSTLNLPINVGGGLIGDGHPVGATGVRQIVEASLQLTRKAGPRQIEGAKRYLTFNMGGSFTTLVTMIWGVEK